MNDPDGSSLRNSSPFRPGILFSRSRARYPGLALAFVALMSASSDARVAIERNMITDVMMNSWCGGGQNLGAEED